MTIKQFMQVAAGTLIALLLYTSTLPPFVKWPLVVISFLAGVALAFFPFEDRPLSKWIILFIKAIYSPTEYIWKKDAVKRVYFQPELGEIPQPPTPTAGAVIPGAPLPTPQPGVEKFRNLEKAEQEFLSRVSEVFTTSPIVPKAKPVSPIPEKEVSGKVYIPAEKPIKVEVSEKPVTTPPPETFTQVKVGQTVSPIIGQRAQSPHQAIFSQEASPPNPATMPNIIVGQILDKEGKIIEGAILEIKDSEGRSTRALKSNRLGHFMIVTPLENGHYEIITEKEGFAFDPISFEAKGEVILPIAIWAKQESMGQKP